MWSLFVLKLKVFVSWPNSTKALCVHIDSCNTLHQKCFVWKVFFVSWTPTQLFKALCNVTHLLNASWRQSNCTTFLGHPPLLKVSSCHLITNPYKPTEQASSANGPILLFAYCMIAPQSRNFFCMHKLTYSNLWWLSLILETSCACNFSESQFNKSRTNVWFQKEGQEVSENEFMKRGKVPRLLINYVRLSASSQSLQGLCNVIIF